MSKIIKSGHLKLEGPRLINSIISHFESPAVADVEEISPVNEEESVDVTQVAKQADDIIKETEQMVKELLGTARQEAEKIIKNAREQADSIIREGQEKLETIKEQGYREGWQGGFTDGTQKAREEMESKLMTAQKTLQEAYEERERIILEAENEIIQLAVNIAEKIIGHEVAANPELIVGITQRALEKVRDREEISLRVNPGNIDAVINSKEKLVTSTQGIKKMKVLADPDITPGGCVIESSNGTVDARVERQLQEIEQSLLEVNANG